MKTPSRQNNTPDQSTPSLRKT